MGNPENGGNEAILPTINQEENNTSEFLGVEKLINEQKILLDSIEESGNNRYLITSSLFKRSPQSGWVKICFLKKIEKKDYYYILKNGFSKSFWSFLLDFLTLFVYNDPIKGKKESFYFIIFAGYGTK